MPKTKKNKKGFQEAQAELLGIFKSSGSEKEYLENSLDVLKNFKGEAKEKRILAETSKLFSELLRKRKERDTIRQISTRMRKNHRKKEMEQLQVERKLLESYRHLGSINRQISILMDLGRQRKRGNSNEIISYIVNSAANISRAKTVKIFKYNRDLKALSEVGLRNGRIFSSKKMIPIKKHLFLDKLVSEKTRVQGLFLKDLHGEFSSENGKIKYFLFLPILSNKKLRGVMFFGFANKNSITPQELDFYEAFSSSASLTLKDLDVFKKK